MKRTGQLLGFTLALSVGAQAAVIDFTDNSAYPVGTDITNHADWAIAVPPASYVGISGTANGIVIGSSAAASEWDGVKYTAEAFNVAIGSAISSSITFTFQQTGNNGWLRLIGTGATSGGASANLNGFLTRTGNGSGDGSNAPYSIGITKTDESSFFSAADLGLQTGATSDPLRLTVENTRKGTDLWDMQITLTNLNSTFSATYTKADLSFGSGDTDALNGVLVNGVDDSSINVANRTISEFTVIPEPATLGLVGAFGGGMLFLRRRFML